MLLAFLGLALQPGDKMAIQTATKLPAQMFSFWRWSGGYLGQICRSQSRFSHAFVFLTPRNSGQSLFLRKAQELLNILIPPLTPINVLLPRELGKTDIFLLWIGNYYCYFVVLLGLGGYFFVSEAHRWAGFT